MNKTRWLQKMEKNRFISIIELPAGLLEGAMQSKADPPIIGKQSY